MKKLNGLVLVMLVAGSVSASVVTNDIVDKTSAVGAEQALVFSLTGGSSDSFDFGIGFSGPYPNWSVGLTSGGNGGLDASQISMANGYHALLTGGSDVAAQGTWVGGNLYQGSSFFSYFGDDPNSWKNSTGYVGLRYKHFVDGVGVVYNYGWAEFSFVSTEAERSITLTRYAYETTVNTTIMTPAAIPEPASALLIGCGGLLVVGYRRMRKSYGHF